MSGPKSIVRWLIFSMAVVAAALAVRQVQMQRLLPLDVAMAPVAGSEAIDPRNPVRIKAVGVGARLAEVQVRDASGKLLAESHDQRRFTFSGPLDFGTRYHVTATVERTWTGQRLTRELTVTTVGKPVLEDPVDRTLDPDGSVTLHFDRPVGHVEVVGPLTWVVEPDATRQSVRLVPVDLAQGQTFTVQLNWNTTTGVPLPPLQ